MPGGEYQMPYVSKEQLAVARELDLLTYLRCHEPEELIHILFAIIS